MTKQDSREYASRISDIAHQLYNNLLPLDYREIIDIANMLEVITKQSIMNDIEKTINNKCTPIIPEDD